MSQARTYYLLKEKTFTDFVSGIPEEDALVAGQLGTNS